MRVIIMAAGRASRFDGISKAFLEINHESIIERMIKQLIGYDLGTIYIVVGHKAEKFLNLKNVVLIPNPDYMNGDNAQGLKVALDAIGFEDTLILDCDLILSEEALTPLLDSYKKHQESVSLVDINFSDPEAMKLVIKDQRIIEYSKEKGVGAEICTLVTGDVLKLLYEDLENIKWWGVGVGQGKLEPRVAPIMPSARWIEIDNSKDYKIAKDIFEV